MTKVVDSFLASTDACQKLAYFEVMSYHSAAQDLERLLQAAEAFEAEPEGRKVPETFQTFKVPWKEIKNQYEKTRRLADGYDDWSIKLWIKLWNATKVALYHVCKQYGIEVPGGSKDQEAKLSIPLLKVPIVPRVCCSTWHFYSSVAHHLGPCTQCCLAVPDLRIVHVRHVRRVRHVCHVRRVRPALMPLYEEKFICPFSIRFSQARIRPTFQDGRDVEASMEEVEAVEAPEGALKDRYDLLLRAPFPPIEIIRWWPKLREEDGETLLDENGKTILGEPCWFTFDNRRLYCLQAAAIKNWPCRAAAVVHVMHDLPVSKCAPKKFRTTDLGCSVRISRRDDVVPKATWTWMEDLEEAKAWFNLVQLGSI
eukprot:s972_g24.t1